MPFIETLSGTQLDALGQRETVRPVAQDRKLAFDSPEAAQTALAAVFSDEADRLFNRARQIVRKPEDCEDVLGDAWIKLSQYAADGRLHSADNIRALCYQTVVNLSIDCLRRRKNNIEPAKVEHSARQADVDAISTDVDGGKLKPDSRLTMQAIAWVRSLCTPSELRALDLVIEFGGDVALACNETQRKGSGFSEPWYPMRYSRLFTTLRQRATGYLRRIGSNQLRFTTKGTLAGWHHARVQHIWSTLAWFAKLSQSEPEPEPALKLTGFELWQLVVTGSLDGAAAIAADARDWARAEAAFVAHARQC